jgi:hypothetical protein
VSGRLILWLKNVFDSILDPCKDLVFIGYQVSIPKDVELNDIKDIILEVVQAMLQAQRPQNQNKATPNS